MIYKKKQQKALAIDLYEKKLGLQTLGILVKKSWGKFGNTSFVERQLLPLYLLLNFYTTNFYWTTRLGQVSIKKYCSK